MHARTGSWERNQLENTLARLRTDEPVGEELRRITISIRFGIRKMGGKPALTCHPGCQTWSGLTIGASLVSWSSCLEMRLIC